MGKPRSRYLDFINEEQVKKYSPITIIGIGGIGSPIAESLARMGFDLILYDHDLVKPENIGSQRYCFPEIGLLKTEALKIRLEKDFQIKVEANAEKFTGQHLLSGIVICGVDSLEERANIWQHIKYNPAIPLYLEGRVGGERFKLFCLNSCDPAAIEKYETHLDLSVPRTVLKCTSKFAPQAGLALDWAVNNIIKEWIIGNAVPFQLIGKGLEIIKIYL